MASGAVAAAVVSGHKTRNNKNSNSNMKEQSQEEEEQEEEQEIDVWPDDLQHKAFFATLKSCQWTETPDKCLRYVPEGTTTERIAVLRPPGAIGFLFEKFVNEVVKVHRDESTDIELIPTSNLPPYGYGKTHGYTKLIRLATLPLRLAAADMVLDQTMPHHDKGSKSAVKVSAIKTDDIKQAVRQNVRWHCRLSHVAAHTSILTVTLEDLMDEPYEEEFKVKEFLGLKDPQQDLNQHLLSERHIDEDEMVESLDQIVMDAERLLRGLHPDPEQLEKLLDGVIDEEMSMTNGLKDWPCLSFWAVGDNKSPDITAVSKTTAASLSPNCDAPYTKCFVKRDRCEFKGDAVCGGEK